eukprot:COSAG05_NODE_8533_length_695_cov_2.246644_1_plen_61_part_10
MCVCVCVCVCALSRASEPKGSQQRVPEPDSTLNSAVRECAASECESLHAHAIYRYAHYQKI